MEKVNETEQEEQKAEFLKKELEHFESIFSEDEREEMQLTTKDMEEVMKGASEMDQIPPRMMESILEGFGFEDGEDMQGKLKELMLTLKKLENGMKAGKSVEEIHKELVIEEEK